MRQILRSAFPALLLLTAPAGAAQSPLLQDLVLPGAGAMGLTIDCAATARQIQAYGRIAPALNDLLAGHVQNLGLKDWANLAVNGPSAVWPYNPRQLLRNVQACSV